MLFNIIDEALKRKASDIHLTKNLPPALRVNGELILLKDFGVLTPEIIRVEIKQFIKNEDQYLEKKYIDSSLSYADYRFRVHIYRQKSSDAAAIRLINSKIPSLESLKLPKTLRKFTLLRCGLVLVTGTTGSGKSTTLASIIDEINETRKQHIISIEDPIEFIHEHKMSIINQREVGEDVTSFSDAVRSAMREDPDIILVGEMRDLETIKNTLTAAETGHLVFATLHTRSVAETVDRIIDVFPAAQQEQIRTQFSNAIQGMVSQHLLPKIGGGRVPACEVLLTTPGIRAIIKEGKHPSSIIDQLQSNHKTLGTQTITQSVANLYIEKLITLETAKEYAEDDEVLKRMIVGACK